MAKKKKSYDDTLDDEIYDEKNSADHDEFGIDEIEIEMHMGDKDADVYSEEGLEEEMEHNEIAPWEQGFMEGELLGGTMGECHYCGSPINEDNDEIFEKKVDGTRRLFCSKDCMDNA